MNVIEHELSETKKLLGGEIIAAIHNPPSKENHNIPSFGFTVRLPDKTTRDVWVDRDSEGSGHGHLSIQKQKSPFTPRKK